jgi:predicted HicB family RNase H-like nuclease
MQYKGNFGKVEYDDEAQIFRGEVIGKIGTDFFYILEETGVGIGPVKLKFQQI